MSNPIPRGQYAKLKLAFRNKAQSITRATPELHAEWSHGVYGLVGNSWISGLWVLDSSSPVTCVAQPSGKEVISSTRD